MIMTSNPLHQAQEILETLSIENFFYSENLLAVERDSMVNANPKLDEEQAYEFIIKLLNETLNQRFFWAGKTDSHLSLSFIPIK
jgi:hypothetical protein